MRNPFDQHRDRAPFRSGALLLPALLAALTAACSTPQAAAPAAGSSTETTAPKVNRVVLAVEPPATESNEPRHHSGTTSWQLDPTFEYLVGLDGQTGKYIPQLATEWSAASDGRSIQFKLRPGVQFHKGYGEVTAEDVKAEWSELVRPDSLAGASSFFKQWVTDIESADGGRTAVFRLKGPTAEFIPSVTQERAGMQVISSAYLKKNGPPTMQGEPYPGTAPFQFKERVQGSFIRFERVPYKHWRATPDFPEVELRFTKEASTRLAGLLAGEVQLADLPQDLQAEAQRRGTYKVIEARAPVARLFVKFFGAYYKDIKDLGKGYVYPDSPMMDTRVRKALGKAVNRDELNKAFFGGRAKTMYLNNFNPNWPGWNPDWEKRSQAEYGYDVATAKQLLADAGYGPGKPLATTMLVLQVAGLSSGGDIAEAIAAYWRNAGVSVEITPMDTNTSGALTRALKLNNHASITATSANIWTGTSTYASGTKESRSGGIGIIDADNALAEAQGTLDEKKQDEYLRKAGNAWYDGHVDVPLVWLPAGVVANTSVIADYAFPGNVTGLWSHLENIRAAK